MIFGINTTSDISKLLYVISRAVRQVEQWDNFEISRVVFIPNITANHVIREIKNLYHVTKFSPYFLFTLYCFYTKISSFMPVLTIGIVPDFFYLLTFYSEKFLTWVWRLPFAVNVNLNLSFICLYFYPQKVCNFHM